MSHELSQEIETGLSDVLDQLPSKVRTGVYGLGVDVASIDRMKLAVGRSGQAFLDRVYTDQEQAYCATSEIPEQRYAACWAAKEAAVKALGTGFRYEISFKDIELNQNSEGKPMLMVKGRFKTLMEEKGVNDIKVSLSHDQACAVATVIISKI